jgi:sorting nexin-7/30/sorting nexin-8
MVDSEEIQQKKELLQSQIIDNNYDQEEFIQFCLSKKENGDDMNNWTFQEMKQTVTEFCAIQEQKNQIPQQTKPIIDSNNNPSSDLETNISNALQFMDKDDFVPSTSPSLNESSKQQQKSNSNIISLKCKRLDKTPLNGKTITVNIQNPKTSSSSSYFSSTYVNYEVETVEVSWLVNRRYSEFEWLRKVLCKFFPSKLIPPLPNKKIGGRRFEADFIQKRMSFLQRFIDEVIQDEILKASEPLIAFLSMTDRNQFDCKMKELSSYIPSPYVEDHRTFTGEIEIYNVNEEDTIETANGKNTVKAEKYFANVKNYFELQTQILERVNYNLKNIYLDFINVCENMEKVEKDFGLLKMLNTKVQMRESITKSYEELFVFFHDWKKCIFKQNELIKFHIKNFFKYSRMESIAYQSIIQYREDIKNKYDIENKRLTSKKEQLWKDMDISKWEIIDDFGKIDKTLLLRDREYALKNMCTKESKYLELMKQQYGLANKMVVDELRRYIKKNCGEFTQNIKTFTEEFYPTLTNSIVIWQRFTSFDDGSN